MIISTRRIRQWFTFLLLFVLFTLLLYQVMSFFTEIFEPNSIYKEPIGDAVKVFSDYGRQTSQATFSELVKERLLWFYEIGE
ncbi:Protein of unknown function [Thermoactinomyces sp. DSM 45891]|uniref:DUF4227 family protein n=1 Tax=Thermoactinomyces sp. DSM 45891 TaxID=1761907 RepID=UPI0009210CBB|nr:DUF4227 family protein [Thermoactinomyces sp. DSM 45891]SFX03226.1 Protein of unknown function [Thermoactinomyces sp. DSM 45891]